MPKTSFSTSAVSSERTDSFPKKSSKKVATLYLKDSKLCVLDKDIAEQRQHRKIPLSRWKSKTPVYFQFPLDLQEDHVATVHLKRLGLAYNTRRLFGNGENLYVIAT